MLNGEISAAETGHLLQLLGIRRQVIAGPQQAAEGRRRVGPHGEDGVDELDRVAVLRDLRPDELRGATYTSEPLTEREIPIIADDYVDPAFGTGGRFVHAVSAGRLKMHIGEVYSLAHADRAADVELMSIPRSVWAFLLKSRSTTNSL